jgi:hypothetical protein
MRLIALLVITSGVAHAEDDASRHRMLSYLACENRAKVKDFKDELRVLESRPYVGCSKIKGKWNCLTMSEPVEELQTTIAAGEKVVKSTLADIASLKRKPILCTDALIVDMLMCRRNAGDVCEKPLVRERLNELDAALGKPTE